MGQKTYGGTFTFFLWRWEAIYHLVSQKGHNRGRKTARLSVRSRTWLFGAFWRQKKPSMLLKGRLFKYITAQTVKLYADPHILWKLFVNVHEPKVTCEHYSLSTVWKPLVRKWDQVPMSSKTCTLSHWSGDTTLPSMLRLNAQAATLRLSFC